MNDDESPQFSAESSVVAPADGNSRLATGAASRLSETIADVAELVDALDLGSSAERRGGSSPLIRTTAITLDGPLHF